MDYNVLSIGIAGKSYAGKSYLSNILSNTQPMTEYLATIGVDQMIRTYPNKKLKLKFWDFAGSDKFKFLLDSYLWISDIILLCFSCRDIDEIHINKLYKHLLPYNKIIILIATKIDLKLNNNDHLNFGIDFSTKKNIPFFEVSAKNNLGINSLLNFINQQHLPLMMHVELVHSTKKSKIKKETKCIIL